MKVNGEFSVKEKEWVETASKYIDSKHLPILGQILKIVDTTSLMIGRALFVGIVLASIAILGGRILK
jgi:hypothetical protein|tara:strand:+ start:206 stop:406 length:201 start_codon:yes stop_codon:yes gene_type:complete